MKSDVITVSSREDRIDLVLSQAEQVASYQKLSPKSALALRLLSEEMMCMMRAINGDLTGDFWIENEGDQYELHLHAVTKVDNRKREQLLSAATSGKNEAHRGLMGKIRAFFEPMEGLMVLPTMSPESTSSEAVWTMRAYEAQVKEYMRQNREGAEAAWDELEKSVIAHVADDVKVSIRGFDVEMVAYKRLV